MNRSRFLLTLLLGSFVSLSAVQYLAAKDFPKGSPKFLDKYKAALAAGKKDKKPVILVFSAVWCGPCQGMKKDVYPSATIQPYHDKFVWAYLDVDDQQNEKAAKQYGVNSIPHIEIVDGAGKSLGQQVGGSSPEAFAKKLDEALKATGAAEAK